ncbi:hypothetical protein [Neomegalonema perideroedes]|uniref:hypothetical protein n=1 Tax=Neomegalonema perideroedes TaxID=217219 RepID=UPI000364E0E6|nr:hypothetical protein [Neomegalonema perideroedes]
MAERESLSAQTERLAALLSKRRGAGAAAAVGTTPKVEAAPLAPPPPPKAPAAEAAAGGTGGDSLSLYFKALGLEDPFSGSDAGASASLEDLLAIQGERPAAAPAPAPQALAEAARAPRPEPVVAPSRPEPAPPPVAVAAEPAPPPPAPPAPEEPAFASVVESAAESFDQGEDSEFVHTDPAAQAAVELDLESEPAPDAREQPIREAESVIALGGAAEPAKAAMEARRDEDPGDFLDQVSFDDPAYGHPEPSPRAPRADSARPAAPAPEHESLDDPAFWESPENGQILAEERAVAEAAHQEAHKREYEAELAVFDQDGEVSAESARAAEEARHEEGEEEAYGAEEEAYAEDPAERRAVGLAEGEMLMPIDAQRAEMIRHLAHNMGCEPEDVVVTALDWYLDALMNAENNGDSDAA